MDEIWITGYGIVSALGIGKEATLQALLARRSGIGTMRYLKSTHTEFPVGEVPLDNEEMMRQLGIAPGTPMTRTALMGMMALREALADAGINTEELPDTGLVSATTVGGMDQSEQHYLDFLENDRYNHFIKTHDCGATTEITAAHFGSFKFLTTVSTACSSAANAVILGANLIRCGHADCVVVGGSECLTKFHLCGFNALMILDSEPCRPFDATRAGLNLGEGAAYLVLESSRHAAKRHAAPQAILAGYGNACDAYHQTASSPDGEGAFRAMSAALAMAAIEPRQVDYINAHGTGTANNDASESHAMRRIWGEALPPVSSTKGATGHTTSASGSIEAAICLLAMRHSFLPASVGFANPDPQCIQPQASVRQNTQLDYVLSNSFGFGGNDTSLLFKNPISQTVATGGRLFPTTSKKALTPRAAAEPAGIFLYAASHISAQQPLDDDWFEHPAPLTEPYVRAVDPDFRQHIPPLEARRMGRLLKRAVITTKTVLQKAPFDNPDAIVTGTGLGCIENTELFLDALCREGENALKPTHFMQSTHNTIGSLAAISLHCHGYNSTYAHKQLSFDSALLDACLQLRLGSINNAIVGAHDELTPSYYNLLCKAGYLGHAGMTASEAALSFAIGLGDSANALCRIAGLRLCHAATPSGLGKAVREILDEAHLEAADISAVMTAANGNASHDREAMQYARDIMPTAVPLLRCRHLFGEGYSSSAAALYTAAMCLHKGIIPQHLMVPFLDQPPITTPKAILIHSYTDEASHSIIIVTHL